MGGYTWPKNQNGDNRADLLPVGRGVYVDHGDDRPPEGQLICAVLGAGKAKSDYSGSEYDAKALPG